MTQHTDSSGLDQPSLDELISLREAAKLSGLSAGHLRLLVRQGNIWGVKLGRNMAVHIILTEEIGRGWRKRNIEARKATGPARICRLLLRDEANPAFTTSTGGYSFHTVEVCASDKRGVSGRPGFGRRDRRPGR